MREKNTFSDINFLLINHEIPQFSLVIDWTVQKTETRKSLKSFLKSFSLIQEAASTVYFVLSLSNGREAKDVFHS